MIYKTRNTEIKLTEEAENTYVAFITWAECTRKGGFGNHRKPDQLKVCNSYDEAKQAMLDLAMEDDNIIPHPDDGEYEINRLVNNNLTGNSWIIWDDGEHHIDIGDGQVHLETVEDMFEDYDCTYLVDHEVNELERTGAIKLPREVWVIMDKTANSGNDYISDVSANYENTSDVEMAEHFDSEIEAEDYIEEKGWGKWAMVQEENVFE